MDFKRVDGVSTQQQDRTGSGGAVGLGVLVGVVVVVVVVVVLLVERGDPKFHPGSAALLWVPPLVSCPPPLTLGRASQELKQRCVFLSLSLSLPV